MAEKEETRIQTHNNDRSEEVVRVGLMRRKRGMHEAGQCGK